jgi:two-component system nitrogen regulation response regulator GlnG
VIERKDLPPEVSLGRSESGEALIVKPVLTAAPEAKLKDVPLDTPAHASTGHESEDLSHVLARAAAAHGPLEGWEAELETEAVALLGSGQPEVWDTLTRRFESRLILAALANTKGRRIEAAQKLGIGRNTITRKIQELGLE